MPSPFTAGTLISAGTIRSTPVYNTGGEALGSIDDLMVDTETGRIAYALMSFGGFLGIGERIHPLPWAVLNYDRERQGYVVPLTRAALIDAPNYGREDAPRWGERAYEERIHDYYKTDRYWIDPMP
ncbi:MAG: PRC-barrel domain-containing protein [Rhizobiales bacterium]|nr:PRC-barrel domain-containing protein [Hyphomicrobiales bacterium]